MNTDRLESLLKYHPFTRLNRLLESVTPGGGNTPILLSLGEPKFQPPAMVAEAIAANADKWGRYPPTAGTEAFRAAVKVWLDRRFGLPEDLVSADHNILPVPGTREALFHVALSATPQAGPGEKPIVLMPNPFYHVYAGAAAAAGAEPLFLDCGRRQGFLPRIEDIPERALERAVLAYLCTPSNPQGAIAGRDELRRWLRLARRHGFVLASDECYSELYLDEPPSGALQAAADLGAGLGRLLVFHSLSKRSSAPGLRSGFVAGDANLIHRQAQLINFGGVATPLPILAAATALWSDEAHVEATRAKYRRNFELARVYLGPIFGELRAKGAFFLWLDVGDGEMAAIELWRQQAIKVLPGGYLARPDAKGVNPGTPYIRVALVHEPEQMAPVLERMARVLREFAAPSRQANVGQLSATGSGA